MAIKTNVEVSKLPKQLKGTVVSVESDELKYTLVGNSPKKNRIYLPGTKLEIMVGDKKEIAKVPDMHTNALKKEILNRMIEYTYTKNVIYASSDIFHNWKYEIITVDDKGKVSKQYSVTF